MASKGIKEDITEDQTKDPVFDARQQYYKLWLYCSHQVKQSAIIGDRELWLRCLNLLFNHVYALLDDEEKNIIDKELSEAGLLITGIQSFNRKDPAYQTLYRNKVLELEKVLLVIERDIYVAMNSHNMLLPKSNPDEEFSVESIMKKMGIE